MCHHRMWKANRRYVELRSQQFLKFDMFQRSRPLYKSPHLTVLNKRQILRFYFPSWNPNFLTDDHWNPWVLVSIWNWVLAKIFYPEVFDNRKSRTDNQVDIFPRIFYSNVQEFALTWQGHFSYFSWYLRLQSEIQWISSIGQLNAHWWYSVSAAFWQVT